MYVCMYVCMWFSEEVSASPLTPPAVFNPTKPSLKFFFFFFFSFTSVGYLFPPLQLAVCLCAWISSEPPVREHVGGLEFSSIHSTLCLSIGAFKVFPFSVIIDRCVLIAPLKLDFFLPFVCSSSLCFHRCSPGYEL